MRAAKPSPATPPTARVLNPGPFPGPSPEPRTCQEPFVQFLRYYVLVCPTPPDRFPVLPFCGCAAVPVRVSSSLYGGISPSLTVF